VTTSPYRKSDAVRECAPPSIVWSREERLLREPAAVVSLYSRIAAAYELWGKLVDGRVRRRILTLASVADGEAILEIGCGDATLLEALARANPTGRTVGIDLADGMLARARKRFRRTNLAGVELRRGDARRIPLDDASFDVVICAYVLDILPDAEIAGALDEIHRVLRPRGRLVLAHAAAAERRRHRFPELLYGSCVPLTSNCRPIEALSRLAEAGFTDRRREYSAQFLLPSEIIAARASAAPGKAQDHLRAAA
jgi:ubiquinone/menaquinone biosynthesis C-methylase UbiE